jgi:DNA-directed RNA polymerase subunit M/transcription elongation factor TFIIS
MINSELRSKTKKEISKYLGTDIAEDVENGIYLFSKEYAENNNIYYLIEQVYENKVDELINIFKSKYLQYIIKKLKDDIIKPDKLAFININDLLPKEEKLEKKKEGTSLFQCPKCKQRNTIVNEVQLRAGDEPADLFITCLECGNVFKM